MIILGVNDGHDAGACLMVDGRVVLVSNEERRLNVKNYAGVPRQSIKAIFERSGIDPKDVELVTLSSMIRTTFPTRGHKPIYSVLHLLTSLARSEWATRAGRWLLPKIRKRAELLRCLADCGIGNKPIQAFDHHLCHAATAYFHRPWDGPATVLTLDGAGDGICASVNIGSAFDLRVISQTPKFHSPAAGLYSAITAHLGLKPYEHEYKVMGMAPYGQAHHSMSAIAGAFSVDGLKFRNHTGRFAAGVDKYFHEKLYHHRFDNICAATQQAFEEMVVKWVHNAVNATGIRRVAAAGGAFLNVKANKLIREMAGVSALYVYPASDDGGTPVGAAILGHLELCKRRNSVPSISLPKSMYQGLEFSEGEMERAAKESGLPYRRMADTAMEVGQMLAAGRIVARFDGPEEIGPRALGNRTIMADPRDLSSIRKLNFAIKQRDFWMPFAASVLEEDMHRYIRNPSDWAFYMTEAFDTTPEGADQLVAGTHPFDRTIRPQIVNDFNPAYRDIIRAFKHLTGVGGILNTSFNLHGYPIVGTPQIALQTLIGSDLDGVALGPFLVTKAPLNVERSL